MGPWLLRNLKNNMFSIFVSVLYFHIICPDIIFGLSGSALITFDKRMAFASPGGIGISHTLVHVHVLFIRPFVYIKSVTVHTDVLIRVVGLS